MAKILSTLVDLTYTGCSICDVPFAVPTSFWRRGQEQGGELWCPHGHKMVFGKSMNAHLRAEAERLNAELARERARRDQAEAGLEHQRRRVQGYQGALVKAKKRSATGVCPVPGCQRSFANVARHVKNQHPEFHPETTDERVEVQ